MKNFNPTIEQIAAASAVFTTMAWEETIRPIVEKIQKEILQKFNYRFLPEDNLLHKHREQIAEGREIPQFVKDYKDIHYMGKKDAGHYFTELHCRYKTEGFDVPEVGYCPLLMAENNTRKAKANLCDIMVPVTGITYNMLISSGASWEKNMKQYFDLTLSLLVPYCKQVLNFATTD